MDSAREARWQAADRIDAVCDEFERVIRSGSAPAIEEFLDRVPEPDRGDLLVELVVLDVTYRRDSGQAPRVEEYAARFPAQATRLRSRAAILLDSAPPSLDSTVAPGAESVSETTPEIPTVLGEGSRMGRYQLQERLGHGSFGEVWRAWDPLLKRTVAIKTLRADRRFPAELTESFLAEGSKLAQFRHPAIVGVYDVAVEGGRGFIVSEFIEGVTLATQLEQSAAPMSVTEAVEIVAQLADALHHAHRHGIVHRDIKPTNILIDAAGRPYLLDFGLAITEAEQLREPAGVVGTVAYMSPEQISERSHHADARADIYGLGVVLYRLLTGRLPFVADSREQWVDQILHRPPRPPRTIDDSIPEDLERICLKCLAKRVEDRYSTAADLGRELRGAISERRSAHRPRRVLVSGLVAGLIVAGLAPLLLDRSSWFTDADAVVPRPVLWPVHDQVSSWSVSEDGKKLHINCEQYGLLEIGELGLPDTELTLELGQVLWTGDLGVFWGLGRAVGGGDRLRFDLLKVDQVYGGDYILRRSEVSFDRVTLADRVTGEVSRAAIAPPKQGAHRLTLRFLRGTLTGVVWDGVEVPDLLDAAGEAEAASDASNRFGLFVNGTSGTFADVEMNGRLIRFSAGMN